VTGKKTHVSQGLIFNVSLKQPWMRIAVRVAGSWVAAIGMLMFGWMAQGQL